MLLALQPFVSPRISWMFDKSEFDKFMDSIDENDDSGYDKNRLQRIRAFYTKPADGTILPGDPDYDDAYAQDHVYEAGDKIITATEPNFPDYNNDLDMTQDEYKMRRHVKRLMLAYRAPQPHTPDDRSLDVLRQLAEELGTPAEAFPHETDDPMYCLETFPTADPAMTPAATLKRKATTKARDTHGPKHPRLTKPTATVTRPRQKTTAKKRTHNDSDDTDNDVEPNSYLVAENPKKTKDDPPPKVKRIDPKLVYKLTEENAYADVNTGGRPTENIVWKVRRYARACRHHISIRCEHPGCIPCYFDAGLPVCEINASHPLVKTCKFCPRMDRNAHAARHRTALFYRKQYLRGTRKNQVEVCPNSIKNQAIAYIETIKDKPLETTFITDALTSEEEEKMKKMKPFVPSDLELLDLSKLPKPSAAMTAPAPPTISAPVAQQIPPTFMASNFNQLNIPQHPIALFTPSDRSKTPSRRDSPIDLTDENNNDTSRRQTRSISAALKSTAVQKEQNRATLQHPVDSSTQTIDCCIYKVSTDRNGNFSCKFHAAPIFPMQYLDPNVTRFLHQDDAHALYDGTVDLDQVVSSDLIRGTQDRIIATVQQPLPTDPDDLSTTTDRKKFADAPETFQYLNFVVTPKFLSPLKDLCRLTPINLNLAVMATGYCNDDRDHDAHAVRPCDGTFQIHDSIMTNIKDCLARAEENCQNLEFDDIWNSIGQNNGSINVAPYIPVDSPIPLMCATTITSRDSRVQRSFDLRVRADVTNRDLCCAEQRLKALLHMYNFDYQLQLKTRDMLRVSGMVIPDAVKTAWELSDAVNSDRRQTLVEAFVQVMMWRRRSSLIKEACTKTELIKRLCAPVTDYALFPCNYVC